VAPEVSVDDADVQLPDLLEAVHRRYHHDFRGYSRASAKRRVLAALPRFDCTTVAQLQELVLRDGQAFARLLQVLTVPVTDLFRDPAFFRAVREEVVPVLRTYPSFRLWVAGCSTGEEVYSYLVLLAEEGLLERATLYATDVNPAALRAAQAGVYDLARAQRFGAAHRAAGGRGSLSEWYTAAYDGIVFDRRLRARAVFSDHSLATDDVFAEVEMVSCRNVLIYFERPLQERAIGLFARALARRGFLGIGPRESLRFSAHAAELEEVRRAERLYRRRA
jgi:chemotaxis protein methyltransferase CheR